MLLIPFLISFIVGWRAKRLSIWHAVIIAVGSALYSRWAVSMYAFRLDKAGYDASQIKSVGNYVYAFGYSAIGCGGLLLLGAWISSRRRIKKAMREVKAEE